MTATKVPQHLEALAEANRKRINLAHLRHAVRDGRLSLAGALDEPDVQNRPVMEVLQWQALWGRQRAMRTLRRMHIGELTIVAGLSEARRAALLVAAERG